MANINEITNGEFSKALENEGLTIVDFYAEWCMPCVMMGPVFEAVAENNQETNFAKVNIEDSQDLAKENAVSSIPCLVFFKDGKEIDRIVGAVDEQELENKIKEHTS